MSEITIEERRAKIICLSVLSRHGIGIDHAHMITEEIAELARYNGTVNKSFRSHSVGQMVSDGDKKTGGRKNGRNSGKVA